MSTIFRSIRFNVVLFLVIAFLAALGTFLPQVTDNAEKVSALLANHPFVGGCLNAWGFFDIYHTFFFAGLLGLMAFDVIVCKLWNKPPDPGLVPLPEESSSEDVSIQTLRKKPFRLDGNVPGSVNTVSKTLLRQLKKGRYSVKKIPLRDGGLAVLASRHRLQRWGSYVSHISLVVILAGAMIKSLFGFETFLPILEGQSAHVVEPLLSALQTQSRFTRPLRQRSLDLINRWDLAMDKLTVDFYHGSTTPSTFASKVRLTSDNQSLADTTIRVNQPLDVHHVRFYQASWGVTGMIRGAVLQVGDKTYDLGMKGSFPIPGEPWTGRIEHYLPDFTISADGEPTTASLEWKNPALVVGFYNKKLIRIGTLALGTSSPVTPPDAQPWAMFFFAGGHLPVRPPFHVMKVEPVLFSGIQVSYDPGFPVIVVGVLSMLLGLSALFYLHQRRLMVFLRPASGEARQGRPDPDSGQTRVDVGGWSSRGEKEFEKEFKELFRALHLKPA